MVKQIFIPGFEVEIGVNQEADVAIKYGGADGLNQSSTSGMDGILRDIMPARSCGIRMIKSLRRTLSWIGMLGGLNTIH